MVIKEIFVFQVQSQYEDAQRASAAAIAYPAAPPAYGAVDTAMTSPSHLYPSLDDYMGLALTQDFVEKNMPVVASVSITGQIKILVIMIITFG